jgi:hypothetical protein
MMRIAVRSNADHGIHCGRTRGYAPTPLRIIAECYVTPAYSGKIVGQGMREFLRGLPA